MSQYPYEDKCRYCGAHLGWVTCLIGEAFALDLCEKPACQKKAEQDAKPGPKIQGRLKLTKEKNDKRSSTTEITT